MPMKTAFFMLTLLWSVSPYASLLCTAVADQHPGLPSGSLFSKEAGLPAFKGPPMATSHATNSMERRFISSPEQR